MWSRSPLTVISTIKRYSTKKGSQDRDRRLPVLQVPGGCLCVYWKSLLSPCFLLKLSWPTLFPRGTQTPSSSVSDMHLGNLSAPFLFPDINSQPKHISAHMAASIKHISAIQPQPPPPDVHVHTYGHIVCRTQILPRQNLTGMLAVPQRASRLCFYFPTLRIY